MLKYTVYAPETYDIEKLREFLINTDDYFLPPTSSRVNLEEWSVKLCENAYIIEVVDNSSLVGLGAFYFNNYPNYSFGTYVCVLRQYQDDMCGVELITRMIDSSECLGSKGFRCEIRKSNKALAKFYRTLGFVIDEEIPVKNSKEIDLIIHKDFNNNGTK